MQTGRQDHYLSMQIGSSMCRHVSTLTCRHADRWTCRQFDMQTGLHAEGSTCRQVDKRIISVCRQVGLCADISPHRQANTSTCRIPPDRQVDYLSSRQVGLCADTSQQFCMISMSVLICFPVDVRYKCCSGLLDVNV